MGVTKDATAQLVKMEQDGPAALQQVPISLTLRSEIPSDGPAAAQWTPRTPMPAEDEMRERLQGAGKGMGAGKGKRVMGGGGPMSQTAQQAELKLEQMVDQRDMAVAKATVNGDCQPWSSR